MTEYAEFFLGSAPSVVLLDCLEISHPDFSQTYRIVRNAPAGIGVTHDADPVTEWRFDGVDDVVSMGDVLDQSASSAFSLTAWGSSDGASAGAYIAKQLNISAAGWRLASAASGQGFGFTITDGTNVATVDTTMDVVDGEVHFVASTYDGSGTAAGIDLYGDGTVPTTSVVSNDTVSGTTTNTTAFQLGKRGSSSSRNGLLAQCAIWNRVLTPTEILEVYNGGDPPDLSTVSCASALIGWWKLDGTDDNSAGGVQDHSGSGFEGTANFDPTVISEDTFDYEYYPARVMPIGAGDDLVQAISITLGDVGDVIATEIQNVWEANGMETRPTLTYRGFRSDNLDAPIRGPISLEIVNVTTSRDGASFEARAPELNASRTGELYTVEVFPMLRGLF